MPESLDETMKSLGELAEKRQYLFELSKRHGECNRMGHVAPNEEDNRCYHCYRRLKYGPRTKPSEKEENSSDDLNITESRVIMNLIVKEIQQQKNSDQSIGLDILAGKIKPAREVFHHINS